MDLLSNILEKYPSDFHVLYENLSYILHRIVGRKTQEKPV